MAWLPWFLALLVHAACGARAHAAAEPRASCADRYDSTSKEGSLALRNAYASFFLTGKGQFWGSAFHVERFIDAVKASAVKASAAHNRTLLVDVGAAPYNTMGGDISHVLTFAKHWPSSSGATIMGFEPGRAPFSRLVEYVEKQVGKKSTQPSRDVGDGEERPGADQSKQRGKQAGTGKQLAQQQQQRTTSIVRDGGRDWIVLRNAPLSDRQRAVKISNQPYAGDNTASLEEHYQQKSGAGGGRMVRSLTLDGELRRRGLSHHEILILKVDVEGHEMSVLNGAATAIREGRVPLILVEYGDKMSPAIWDAMKRPHSAAAAAPTAAALPGPSLYSLQRWADERGYDTFLLGSAGHRPVLIGVTGTLWREEYEVCRDKNQKFSPNGRDWKNFSAWNPYWAAVCWYDVALILREPREPRLRSLLLEQCALPDPFCRRLREGWYPEWMDAPWPTTNLCCAHTIARPQHGEVCHTFRLCKDSPKQRGPSSWKAAVGRALSQLVRPRRSLRSIGDGRQEQARRRKKL